MTDTSKDAVDRLVLFMVRSGNTTAANMLTALADERDAANARADQARDAALVEAAGTLEAQALDAEAQAKRFRGGSDPWADRTARARALRNSANAMRALPAVQVTVKPLEWEIVPTGYGPETYEAYAATGFYQVFTDEDSCCGAVFAEFATNRDQFGTTAARGVARVNSFADAKAAAQADYAARIRHSLAVTPAPDAAKVAALVDAFEHLLNNYLLDEHDEPELCVDDEHWSAIHDAFAALAAIKEPKT